MKSSARPMGVTRFFGEAKLDGHANLLMVATLGSKYCPMKEVGADGSVAMPAPSTWPRRADLHHDPPARVGWLSLGQLGWHRCCQMLQAGHPPLLTEALSPMSGALWGFWDFFSFESLPAYNYRLVSSKNCINT